MLQRILVELCESDRARLPPLLAHLTLLLDGIRR